MKKKLLFWAAVMLIFLMIGPCMRSVQAEPLCVAEYQQSRGSIEIYISGLRGTEDYVLMALRGPDSFAPDNLAFLDQVSTGANGTLSLCFVQPDLAGTQLAIGGKIQGEASPYVLCTVENMDGARLDAPQALTAIGEEAFASSGFQYVYLGSQVLSIGSRAFAGCLELKAIHIPYTVTEIAEDAFDGCSSLVIVCEADSTASAFAVRNGIPYILK